VLGGLPKQPTDSRLLVGYDTADDAGVFLIRDGLALVQTVDFFTPIVDDPYTYGRIAALNSLNDVWAMGGEALTALSVAGFPRKGLPFSILGDIFRGGLDTLTENGVLLLGGHTVDDPEIKFGYAVTGQIDPGRILRNAGARLADALVLTKPIGTGIVSTAIKFKRAPADVVDAALATMLHSSRLAARLAIDHGAHGATDVTGFGLLGHAFEVAAASHVRMRIDAASVPLLPGVLALAKAKNLTRGDRTNREYTEGRVRVAPSIDVNVARALFDPQTAGGLLVALPEENAASYVEALRDAGYVSAAVVGRCEEESVTGEIEVV
jgi:selenide,water dikinase